MRIIKPLATGFILVLLFTGCISNVIVEAEKKPAVVVLNCILNTGQDSIVAWLSKTKDIGSGGDFESIMDADLTLYEDHTAVGTFLHSDTNAYVLNYKPLPGKTYRLEANVETEKVWGETTVPLPAESIIQVYNPESYMRNYQVQFTDNQDEENFYWISAIGNEGGQDDIKKNIACVIYSNYEYADDFNQYFSNNGIFNFEYDYYLRFNDLQLSGEITEVIFSPQCISYPIEVFLITADYHLDKYMKSSLMLQDIELHSEEMPIMHSPQPVYSNIHGGTGIVGSMNYASKTFYGK